MIVYQYYDILTIFFVLFIAHLSSRVEYVLTQVCRMSRKSLAVNSSDAPLNDRLCVSGRRQISLASDSTRSLTCRSRASCDLITVRRSAPSVTGACGAQYSELETEASGTLGHGRGQRSWGQVSQSTGKFLHIF